MKHFFKFFPVFILAVFFNNQLFGQVSEGGTPYSFQRSIVSTTPTIQMPEVDVEAYLLEDEIDAQTKNIPFRFGAPHDVELTIKNSGEWISLPNGDKLWKLRIYSPGAYTLNLLYNDFWLPEGAKLFLYNDDRTDIIGAFTHKNNKEHGEFATGLTRGDAVTLEYYEPSNVNYPGIISISRVVHGYRDLLNTFDVEGFGSSGSCNNNVNCPEGADWQDTKRSIAMVLLSGGTRWCSGSLINNTNVDMDQLFLTANHCLGSSNTWIFMFNYESPTCANIDGPTNFTVQGSTLLASNADSDFGLVRITEEIPESYQVHWAGWDRRDIAADSVVAIHHPSGDIKKISFEWDPVVSDQYLGTSGVPDSHWWVTSWDDGTTEPGSSGSPIFNYNHQIVGQLHGGYASCTDLRGDWYGKVSMSWDRGTTPSTRLKDWLDPGNTGALFLDGWDPTVGDPDAVPPTTITDLTITDVTSNSMTLTWTAPLDTSYQGTMEYYIKYSESPINEGNFDAAMDIPFTAPKEAGETEMLIVEDLDFSTDYYFAIKSRDFWDNVSAISNVPTETTWGIPEAEVNPTSLTFTVPAGSSWVSTVNLANTSAHNSTLDYLASIENISFPTGAVLMRLKPVETANLVEASGAKGDDFYGFGQLIEGAGGPDDFGYQWIDSDDPNGPAFVWNDISASGTQLSFTGGDDDGYSTSLSLGFNFDFYENTYSSVSVSTNGVLSFTPLTTSYRLNNSIPDTGVPNNFIAAFWDDLDGDDGQGSVYYKADQDKFTVQFTNWKKWVSGGSTGDYNFQIVIHSNGKILLYYDEMVGTLNQATVGIENITGTDGLQISHNANYPPSNQFAVQIWVKPDWVSTEAGSGTIYNGNSVDVELVFETEDLTDGVYEADMVFTTNIPDKSQIIVPVSLTIDGVVPVELTAFSAEQNKGEVRLYWTTATETNNRGFEIERKTSGKNEWQTISFVQGMGTKASSTDYTFEDKSIQGITNVSYRLKQIDFDGTYSYSNIVELELTPANFSLMQNYPNPFNPSTKIEFSIPAASEVMLKVYDVLGRNIATLVNQMLEPGYYEQNWNAESLSSGLYIYVLEASPVDGSGGFRDLKKMVLIK